MSTMQASAVLNDQRWSLASSQIMLKANRFMKADTLVTILIPNNRNVSAWVYNTIDFSGLYYWQWGYNIHGTKPPFASAFE